MKLKLDENLGLRGRDLLIAAGHDVCTVLEQELCSATDEEIARRCAADGRAVVTLDLDFANPIRFPPKLHRGIAVLRGPSHHTEASLEKLVLCLIAALRTQPLDGHLWIVEPHQIRVFQSS